MVKFSHKVNCSNTGTRKPVKISNGEYALDHNFKVQSFTAKQAMKRLQVKIKRANMQGQGIVSASLNEYENYFTFSAQ